MHLYQLRLIDYRRFVDATINLDSKMVAILGPNESGKSSLLDALKVFNDQDRVPAAALRKGSDKGDHRVVGELTYLLDKDDRAIVPYRVPKSQAQWLKATKRVGGVLDFELLPAPSRPLSARQTAASALKSALTSAWYEALSASGDDSDEDEDLAELLEHLAAATDSYAERLDDDTIEELDRRPSSWRPWTPMVGRRRARPRSSGWAESCATRARSSFIQLRDRLPSA